MSRLPEQREDKRPQLSDSRDYGSIEQGADVVMFVFREEYYLPWEEPTQGATESIEEFNQRRSTWEEEIQYAQNITKSLSPNKETAQLEPQNSILTRN